MLISSSHDFFAGGGSSLVTSKITDHHANIKNDEKVWNIMRITKMWLRDMKWANAIGKWHK